MSIAVTDVNKSVIMKMLRTDVFGFSAEDIENKAKEIHSLIVNDGQEISTDLRMIGSYGRNKSGYIVLFKSEFSNNITNKKSKKK